MAGSDYNLRLRILGDDHEAIDALEHVGKVAELTSERILHHFTRVGRMLRAEAGFFGIAAGIEKGLDLASVQVSAQKVQSTLLNNQKAIGGVFAGTLVALDGANRKIISGNMNMNEFNNIARDNLQVYSLNLDKMATQMSLQSGIAKNQIIQAQNVLLPNKDLVTLFQQQAGTMQLTLNSAANISAIMGSNGRGIAGTARMLSRILADPAKSMGMMRRFGITLSKQEQARIKQVEQTNGLLAAQALFLKDINSHVQGIAENSISPMQKLKNSVTVIFQTLGLGLLPILDTMAKDLAGVVNTLLPILQGLQGPVREVSDLIGKGLSEILTAMVPLIQIFTQGFLPLILKVTNSLTTLFGRLFSIFDTFINNHMSQIIGMFTTVTNLVTGGVAKAFTVFGDAFQQMASSGKLGELFKSLVQSFTLMVPIIPALANLFSQLVFALLPGLVTFLPGVVASFNLMAQILKLLAPLINAAASAIQHISGGPMKGLITAVGVLAGIWFTRALFIVPLNAVGDVLAWLLVSANKVLAAFAEIRAVGFLTSFRGGGGTFLNKTFSAGVKKEEKAAAKAAEKAAAHAAESAAAHGVAATVEGEVAGGGLLGLLRKLKAMRAAKGAVEAEKAAKMAADLEKASYLSPELRLLAEHQAKVEAAVAARAGYLRAYSSGFIEDGSGVVKEAAAKPGLFARLGSFLKFGGRGAAVAGGAAAAEGGGSLIGSIGAALGPIAAIAAAIGGLIALWVELYKHSETFRRGLHRIGGFFTEVGKGIAKAWFAVWHFIDGAYQRTVHFVEFMASIPGKIARFIAGAWNGLVSFIEGLPGRILKFAENIGATIWRAIVNAYHTYVPGWMQGVISTLGSVTRSIGSFVGGAISHFHSGGVVGGRMGSEGLAMVKAGEGVLTPEQMKAVRSGGSLGGGGNLVVHPNAVTINVQGSVDPQVAKMIQDHVSAQFGELQRTLRTMGR